MSLKVDVSAGELLDKVTILEIKSERIADPAKLANVRRELEILRATWNGSTLSGVEVERVADLVARLKAVNEALWEIEDGIRRKERDGAFDDAFIALARSVYRQNDLRAALKRDLNGILDSDLVEEKSYVDYDGDGDPI